MVKKEDTWFRSKRPRRNKKKTHHSKAKALSILLSIGAVLGFVKAASSQKHSSGQSSSVSDTLANLDQQPRQGFHLLSPRFQHQESLPALDNAEAVMQNSTSNQLFRTLQPLVPEGTSTNQLWLYTSVLQKLSTDTNNVCAATNMPSTNYVHFVQMLENTPTNELEKVVAGEDTYFDFDPVKKAFENPTNTAAFAQTVFEQGSLYNLWDSMLTELPKYEGDTDHMYWDNARNVVTNNGVVSTNYLCHPSIKVGMNFDAHPVLLTMVRFKNSKKVQEIIEPDPRKRSDAEYISLSREQLNRLTTYVRKHHPNCTANEFRDLFGLTVHPDDVEALGNYYKDFLAKTIRRTNRYLSSLATADFSEGSVMFGSYLHPLHEDAPKVPVDIAYNTGSASKYPNCMAAYARRDWETAIRECVPSSGKPVDRCNWRKKSLRNAKTRYEQDLAQQQRLQQQAQQQPSP